MSGQIDPWDAMAQNDDSDEDYTPTGADGIDDDDDYRDIDEDDASDEDELEVLSPCTPSFICMASTELGSGCPQTSNTETEEGQILRLASISALYGNFSLMGWLHGWRTSYGSKWMRKTKTTKTTSIHPIGAPRGVSSALEITGTLRSLNPNLPG